MSKLNGRQVMVGGAIHIVHQEETNILFHGFGGVTYLMPNMSLQPSNKLFVHSSPLIQISVLVTRFHILYTVQRMAFFLITLECPKHAKRNWLRVDVP
jgi:hypothetical protein